MADELARTRMLLGDEGMERLKRSRVAVFGLGGVGGYVVEALARSGVGALDLVDNDTVAPSNLNRQIIATRDTLGMKKTEAAAQRVRSIDPTIRVKTFDVFLTRENAGDFTYSDYDYIVDAIDTVSAKIELICRAQAAGVPIISSMGTGNKLDPSRLRIADLSETRNCPLARVMRKELRRRGVEHVKVVFSTELPMDTPPGGETREASGRPVPGSVAFVPSAAGLLAAGEIVRHLSGAKPRE